MSDNLLLDLTPSELNITRQALRLQSDTHKRNGFKVLEQATNELREKINNAMLDNEIKLAEQSGYLTVAETEQAMKDMGVI